MYFMKYVRGPNPLRHAVDNKWPQEFVRKIPVMQVAFQKTDLLVQLEDHFPLKTLTIPGIHAKLIFYV
jgi:hypothetical protein